MSDGTGIDTDVATHQLPDVERLVVGRIHLNLDRRPLQIDQVCTLAGSEDDIAIWCIDDAVVFDIGSDEGNQAAARGSNHSLVDDAAGARLLRKVEPARQKIGIRQPERRRDKSADVNLRIGPERNAVLIDQEYPPVRLQGAKNYAGVPAGDAIQHLARGARLDEAGDLALPDGESLPVDHRSVCVGDGERIGGALECGAARDHGGIERIGLHQG